MSNSSNRNSSSKFVFLIAREEAVSTALGFVLIVGILVTSFTIFMATQVPQTTKVLEAQHSYRIPKDFSRLAAAIDTAILYNNTVRGSEVDMEPKGVPIVGVLPAGGRLEFNATGERFSYKACAPSDTLPPDNNTTHWWNSTPANFSVYEEYHVVTTENGTELALEVPEQNLIFDSGKVENIAGVFRCNNFVVNNSTVLWTSGLIVRALNIYVGPDSIISASGHGAAGGIQDHDGEGASPGKNSGNDCSGGGGGGYGGKGGKGGNSSHGDGGAGGEACCDPTNYRVHKLGSGGGGGSTGEFQPGGSQIIAGEGGNGGGYIVLDAQNITIAGILSANGGNGGNGGGGGSDSAGGGGGGGAGGCIRLRGDYINLTNAVFYAKGGNGGDGGEPGSEPGGGGGGGGGGVIKIFYNSSFINDSFTYDVSGGRGGKKGGTFNGTQDGENGTNGTYSVIKQQYYPEVYYYASGELESSVYDTGTPLVRYGNITWNATVPEDTSIVIRVRTSIDPDMSTALPWEDCPPVVNGADISDLPSVSNGHRYVQWRAKFYTTDLYRTPVLHYVNLSYEHGIPFLVNSSGYIEYHSQYTRYPDFRILYAQGGILKKQGKKGFMLTGPHISISISRSNETFKIPVNASNCTDICNNTCNNICNNICGIICNKSCDNTCTNICNNVTGDTNITIAHIGDIISLHITTINLTGNATSSEVSGRLKPMIKPSGTDSTVITDGLYYCNLSINIFTEHPEAWYNWFNKTCNGTGLNWSKPPVNWSKAPVYYINDSATDRLQVVFYGNETIPVRLWLTRAETRINLESGL